MKKIITAKDIREQQGFRDNNAMNRAYAGKHYRRIKFNEVNISGKKVEARIDYGRLIADCECGGAEYVDPDDLRFFCHSCGNQSTGGAMRPIKIGRALLKEATD